METVKPSSCSWGRRVAWFAGDAGVCWVCYSFLTGFFFSDYALGFEKTADFMKIFSILWVVCAAAMAVSLHAALRHEPNRKGILLHVILCIPAHILLVSLVVLSYFFGDICFFHPEKFPESYGFLYFFVMGAYGICAALLRLGVLVIHLMRSPKSD